MRVGTMDIESKLANLIDDRDFIQIVDSRARFNIFEAIGGERAELRHSNFLSFLLSPARSHGLGNKALQMILRALLAKVSSEHRPIPALEVAVADLDEAFVFREVDYIDILIEIRELNLVVVIENKVGSKAGDGQLERYRSKIEIKYAHWKKLFVYLTPVGDEPNHDEYIAFSYTELAAMLDHLLLDERHLCGPDMLLVLKHYTEMLRRHIVDDEALRNLAVKIYERHAEALDFIFKCKPQTTSMLPIAQEIIESDERFSQDRHSPTIFRFYPKKWENVPSLKACSLERWTKTGRNVLFEIKSFKSEGEYSDRILLSLVLGPCEVGLRRSIFDEVHKRRDIFVNPNRSIGQSWVTIFSRELLSAVAAENMDETEKHQTIRSNLESFKEVNLDPLVEAVYDIGMSMRSDGGS